MRGGESVKGKPKAIVFGIGDIIFSHGSEFNFYKNGQYQVKVQKAMNVKKKPLSRSDGN